MLKGLLWGGCCPVVRDVGTGDGHCCIAGTPVPYCTLCWLLLCVLVPQAALQLCERQGDACKLVGWHGVPQAAAAAVLQAAALMGSAGGALLVETQADQHQASNNDPSFVRVRETDSM